MNSDIQIFYLTCAILSYCLISQHVIVFLHQPSMQQERQAIAQLTPKLTDDQLQQHLIATGHQFPHASQPSEDGRLLQPGKRPVGRRKVPAEEADVEEKIAALLRLHKTKQNFSGFLAICLVISAKFSVCTYVQVYM